MKQAKAIKKPARLKETSKPVDKASAPAACALVDPTKEEPISFSEPGKSSPETMRKVFQEEGIPADWIEWFVGNASRHQAHMAGNSAPPTKNIEIDTDISDAGKYKVRVPATPKHEYNPAGISLEAVRDVLSRAVNSPPSVEGMSILFKSSLSALQQCALISTDEGHTRLWARDTKRLLMITNHKLLFDKNDGARASAIWDHPDLLILSPEHQEAVSRWLYASKYAQSEDKRWASDLLKTALGKVGRRSVFFGNAMLLLQAYEDLLAYIKGLKTALALIRKGKEKQSLLSLFPDCGELEAKPGEYTEAFRNDAVKEMLNPKYKLPSPSDDALAFIGNHTGMRRTLILKQIDAARQSAQTTAS